MKLITIEYDDYHIGFGDLLIPTTALKTNLMRIYKLFIKEKPLYVFFHSYIILITNCDIKNLNVRLKLIFDFVCRKDTLDVGLTYNLYTLYPLTRMSVDREPDHESYAFYPNDPIYYFEDKNKEINPSLKVELEEKLVIYSRMTSDNLEILSIQ